MSAVSILSQPALSFSVLRDCFLSVGLSVGQLLILFDLELPGQIREYRVGLFQSESGKPGRIAGVCQEVEARCKQI